ncbi:hypothetical protein AN958_00674 [Leucoagaricus sp. SymC.cos]|nr:hypothetical protein AN958_00674 [Leucoagaricus sp. SymC.cos]
MTSELLVKRASLGHKVDLVQWGEGMSTKAHNTQRPAQLPIPGRPPICIVCLEPLIREAPHWHEQ